MPIKYTANTCEMKNQLKHIPTTTLRRTSCNMYLLLWDARPTESTGVKTHFVVQDSTVICNMQATIANPKENDDDDEGM